MYREHGNVNEWGHYKTISDIDASLKLISALSLSTVVIGTQLFL